MANKPTTKGAKPRRTASRAASGTGVDGILDAALAEAAAVGWRNLTMRDVAERAGLPLGEILASTPTRAHLIPHIFSRLDRRMLAGVKGVDAADTVRDRLFEIAMKRFDAMNADREGLRAVVTGIRFDPASVAMAMCRAERSAAAVLAAAGVSPDGMLGFIRVQGMKVVFACALRAWIDDESPDLSKTMAALDRALARAERLASFRGLRKRGEEAVA